jgi:hypothetical protein
MEKERPEQTLDELEQEVIDELNLEYSPDENPNKMYSVVFPYQVRFTIPDDQHNTEVIINTKTEEFYSGRNPQDVLFQKEQSDRYAKTAFIKHIQKYVREELWRVEPEAPIKNRCRAPVRSVLSALRAWLHPADQQFALR